MLFTDTLAVSTKQLKLTRLSNALGSGRHLLQDQGLVRTVSASVPSVVLRFCDYSPQTPVGGAGSRIAILIAGVSTVTISLGGSTGQWEPGKESMSLVCPGICARCRLKLHSIF
jgi:hypothetical protein